MKRLYFLLVAMVALQGLAARPADGQFISDKNVLRATLKNGLRVVIVRNPLAPVVTTIVNYEVGSDKAPEGFPGMAHALEHMMFRGNPGLTADQLAHISAAMGGNFDANTQQTITQYNFTVPAGRSGIGAACRIATDAGDPRHGRVVGQGTGSD